MQILSVFFLYWDAPVLIFKWNDCLWRKVYVTSLSWPLVELETRYQLIVYSELLLLQNKTDNLFEFNV